MSIEMENITQAIDCIDFTNENLQKLLITDNKALHLLILIQLEKLNTIRNDLNYLLDK
jgi:hypothetical protein